MGNLAHSFFLFVKTHNYLYNGSKWFVFGIILGGNQVAKTKNEVIRVIPLGGVSEIGKAMYVVEIDEELFVVDSGLMFPEDEMLGIDYVIPDMTYLEENKSRVKGIFLTEIDSFFSYNFDDANVNPDRNGCVQHLYPGAAGGRPHGHRGEIPGSSPHPKRRSGPRQGFGPEAGSSHRQPAAAAGSCGAEIRRLCLLLPHRRCAVSCGDQPGHPAHCGGQQYHRGALDSGLFRRPVWPENYSGIPLLPPSGAEIPVAGCAEGRNPPECGRDPGISSNIVHVLNPCIMSTNTV